ncbi:Sterol 3-beta-glucosyltransferase [Symbiodinium microadriaticum]|uniref:Sterol 3-beta-glucosyltransferase n=1 Tax=Symbiodinium microadriaticum TaxID=2951 RepID=A0A1Q9ELT4_SYMMI|nr:Sterol 3-beta-glucosyltransferase [Symbiodinium microadriaticum]
MITLSATYRLGIHPVALPCPSNILASNQQAEELRHHNVPLIVPVSPVALGEQVATLADKGMKLTDFIFLRQGSCQLDAEVSDFIARAKQDRRKVVAMTFSSMPVGERRMLEIASAICRRCHTPDEGRKPVVIALVSGQPPEETNIPDIQRLEEKQRLLVLRRPVDFGALFPKVDAAILHGGLGVTSEALLAGIPVVTSGILLMDQRYWAARIHELGSGCEVARLELSWDLGSLDEGHYASSVPAGPMAPVAAASTEDEDVSFQVSLMNGANATITCKPADKLQSLHGRISEALEGVGCRSPLCYFRSTQESPQLLAGHTEAAEVAGAEIRVVVQAEPIWCSEKCFRRAASFNELPGYLDDQWEEERLRFFTCGVFELHKHFHSNHGSMPAEDCLEKENYLVATGEWELDGEDVLLIGMQKIFGRSSGQCVTKSFRRKCRKRDLLFSPSWIVTSIGSEGEVIPEYYRGSIECIDRNVVREPVDW